MILWYDCETEMVKIASHCKFDEGFNDLPIESVPIGFQQLIRINQNQRLPEDQNEIDSSDLDCTLLCMKMVIKKIIITMK